MVYEFSPKHGKDYQPPSQDVEHLFKRTQTAAQRFSELYRDDNVPNAASFHGDLSIGTRKRPGSSCVTISRIDGDSTHIYLTRQKSDEIAATSMVLTDDGVFQVEDISYPVEAQGEEYQELHESTSNVYDPNFSDASDLREFNWLLVQANSRTIPFGVD